MRNEPNYNGLSDGQLRLPSRKGTSDQDFTANSIQFFWVGSGS